MMLANSRLNNITLVAACSVLIVVSLVLFLSAMTLQDVGQSGRETIFSTRSSILILIAFVLLGGLALTLLIFVTRTLSMAVVMPLLGKTASARQGSRKSAPIVDADATSSSAGNPEQRDALEALRNKSVQILKDAAGELRISVGVIQEKLEEMREDEGPAEIEQMQSLLEETDRLKQIIDGMEQLSQAQTLARSLRRESFELEPLLKTVLEKTRNLAHRRDVKFTLECEQGLIVTADAECLRRIIENLMDNAAKAVKNAGSVVLSTMRNGDDVVSSVADTGCGIRAEHLSHIYERFFRGTGTGIGMGLTIAKELVDACGGTIEVHTEPGKGSVFTVHIAAA